MSNETRRKTILNRVIERIDCRISRLISIRNRLQTIADSLQDQGSSGPIPEHRQTSDRPLAGNED